MTRTRVADIERNINQEVRVKQGMIDFDDTPKFTEGTKVDIELLQKLAKKPGVRSKDHALPNMVNVQNTLCEDPGCSKQPTFNVDILIFQNKITAVLRPHLQHLIHTAPAALTSAATPAAAAATPAPDAAPAALASADSF